MSSSFLNLVIRCVCVCVYFSFLGRSLLDCSVNENFIKITAQFHEFWNHIGKDHLE